MPIDPPSAIIGIMLGMLIHRMVTPGWRITIISGGKLTWRVSRIPCKCCRNPAQEGGE